MAGRKYNITKNITQTLDVLPFLYAIAGMRLHAGILSCVHHIPYIPISYGLKTDELIKQLDLQHLMIQSTELSLDFFETKWNLLLENYDKEHENMKLKHELFRENLIKNLENI